MLDGLGQPNCSLTALVLESVALPPEVMKHLALALQQENRLNRLELLGCRIDSESELLLGAGLSANVTVEALLLGDAYAGAPLLAGLKQNASIRELYVTGMVESQRLLCDMLEQNRSLEVISGSRVKLDADAVLQPDP